MSSAYRRRPLLARLALLTALSATAATLAACDGSGYQPDGNDGAAADKTTAAAAAEPTITMNVKRGATQVPVNRRVKVTAQGGTLTKVVVRSGKTVIDGKIKGQRWVASELLEPGVRYRVRAVAKNDAGTATDSVSGFTTTALTLDEQTYPSVAPLQGETVGVGMPVVVHFDRPVTNKASIEKHMSVTATPVQKGSWRWVGDHEAHWRPKSYWKAGSKVSVDVDINSIPAGDGIYGQEDRKSDFNVGDAHIYRVNAQTHQLKVFSNGKLLRTMPTTTGKSGFTTRSGVKVIMEKFASRRMNSETVGIPRNSSEAYDIDDVQWAMRITSSGELIHAAPWSVGSQGHANVSHGCTGLSTSNADWLYHMTLRGDVVKTVGTDRSMEPDNGWGEWNLSWADYKAGSAL
ncbi:MAG: Ig-like domain-containing protein [Nocardioidaceae bacterium]|nr:Ig-like domain-containing protein [Nocardioidaceae bacterium]